MAEPPELNTRQRSTGARRASAIAGLVIGFGIFAVLVLVVRAGGDDDSSPAEPAAQAAPDPAPIVVEPVQTMRIVFPEGFTREQMAKRINAVNMIAEEERGLTPSLVPREYRQATKADLRPPGFRGRRGSQPRRLPLSSDLRVHRRDDLRRTCRHATGDVRAGVGQG